MCYEVRLEEDSTNAMSVPPATSLLPSVLDPRPMTVKKITRNQSLFASIARNGNTLRISVGNFIVVPPKVRNVPPTINKIQGVLI